MTTNLGSIQDLASLVHIGTRTTVRKPYRSSCEADMIRGLMEAN